MDSSQSARLGHQAFQQGSEQAFAADTDVMHELKEPRVERQFFLRDPPMGSQPRVQQGPEPFSGIDMNLMETVTIQGNRAM